MIADYATDIGNENRQARRAQRQDNSNNKSEIASRAKLIGGLGRRDDIYSMKDVLRNNTLNPVSPGDMQNQSDLVRKRRLLLVTHVPGPD